MVKMSVGQENVLKRQSILPETVRKISAVITGINDHGVFCMLVPDDIAVGHQLTHLLHFYFHWNSSFHGEIRCINNPWHAVSGPSPLGKIFSSKTLLQLVGIHNQGHRSVIHGLHQHMCAKNAMLGWIAQRLALL